MTRIVDAAVAGEPFVCRISDYHGNAPSQEIMDFCGQNVINELDRKLQVSNGNSTSVYFEKDGKLYKVYKGPNQAVTIPGKYTYNVYECR